MGGRSDAMGGERQFKEGFAVSRLLDAVAEEALAVGCDAVAHESHVSHAFGK